VAKYVALLRGVNVSGHRRLQMSQLREALEGLGFDDVRTYLQSGNAVFDAGTPDLSTLARAITDALSEATAESIDVLVLTAERMIAVAEHNPFLVDASAGAVDRGCLHATFLFEEPTVDAASLDLPAAEGEQVEACGDVIYLRLPHGMGRTKLNNVYFERVLQTTATTRNWNTVTALAEMVGA
jgi:uncharacterized protein (DUF1697 family)